MDKQQRKDNLLVLIQILTSLEKDYGKDITLQELINKCNLELGK